MRRIISIVAGAWILLYGGLYGYFYSIQDDRFKSDKLSQDYAFEFKEKFEELKFNTKNGGLINSLLFKTDNTQGVICFWKGNGGTLKTWGLMAPQFLKCKYDIIITDYREHGKSTGEITIENFYSDSQLVYDFLKTRYSENQIVIMGYSLGTSIASHLATENKPVKTILIEPREKVADKYLEAFFFPFPNITRFPFRSDLDFQKIKTPIAIIVGTKSSLYQDALRLRTLLNKNDSFFEIQGADHGSILRTRDLEKILCDLLTHDEARR